MPGKKQLTLFGQFTKTKTKKSLQVAVYVDNQRPYIGKAIDVDVSDVHITFMAPYLDESHQYFRWPKSEDKIWVDSHEILCVVPEPNSNKWGFTLPEMSRKSALELYSSWK